MTTKEPKPATKDPVCGMTVDEATAARSIRDGKAFYFCGEHCQKSFLSGADPEKKSGGCCT
ncbi:MAG: YHS domain-containing protein [Elusimicrobiota bacterium]|nr:MAG: YHS domain-containing protein [Elusimicrobiota bacterium]